MTSTMLEHPAINVPRIYGFLDELPNAVGAEVVLLEKVRPPI